MSTLKLALSYAGVLLLSTGAVFFPAPASGSASEKAGELLDPSTGELEGKTALAIYPVRYEGTSAKEILNPPGCEVRLLSAAREEGDVERVHPCATWFLEEPGVYLFWIETADWQISPFTEKVVYSARPFEGRGMPGATSLGPAGRLVLPDAMESNARYELRLLHAGPHQIDGLLRWELSRRVAIDQAEKGVLMPAGPTVGALWDRLAGRYVMLSPPFTTEHQRTREVPLGQPAADRAHLVAQIARHRPAFRVSEAPVDVSLVRGDKQQEPDFTVFLTENLYAFWYDLQPGQVELRAGTKEDVLEPIVLDLEPGMIERALGRLGPRPALDVELEMPSILRNEETRLEVRRLPSQEVVARRTLAPGSWSERIEGLPRAPLEVVFQSSAGSVSETVDLSDGENGFVHLDLDVVVLTGHVFLGDEPHPAKLTFTTIQKHSAVVETDTDGGFEVLALDPFRSVSIDLEGEELAPFVEYFPKAITGSTDRDFIVPDRRFVIRVVDAVSGRPIADAEVTIRNRYEAGDSESSEMAVMQQVRTDEEGTALSPPLRSGQLEAEAFAEGYSQMREPMVMKVEEEVEAAEMVIPLSALGESSELRLRLVDGRVAAGARVAMVDSLQDGFFLFESTADTEGVVALPSKVSGIVLIRHDQAGFLVHPWPPEVRQDDMEWQLPAAAGRPFTVQVRDAWGDETVRRAGITLWVDGWRLSGKPLAWLTDTRGFADNNGFWSTTALPPRPVSILAWHFTDRDAAASGSWDTLATEVALPWPEVVEARALSTE